MLMLMKNKSEIGYKITLGGWRVEKGVELGLERIGREWVGGGWNGDV